MSALSPPLMAFCRLVGNLLTVPLVLVVVQTDALQIGTRQKFLRAGYSNAVLCSHCLENPTNATASENPILEKFLH